MQLIKARVQKYRSIHDTGWFDIEDSTTILVGPNEAGKTVLLQALQRINPPKGISGFDALRDYPRSEYNDITTKTVDPATVTVVEAHFRLAPEDIEAIPAEFADVTYVCGRRLDNSSWDTLDGAPPDVKYSDISKNLTRLAAHVDARVQYSQPETSASAAPSAELEGITKDWSASDIIDSVRSETIAQWLKHVFPLIEEGSEHEKRHDNMVTTTGFPERKKTTLNALRTRLPVFVLFSNYFRVRPLIHLEHLAQRLETGVLDDDKYDYGNECLLRLLGFTARELSDLGKAPEPQADDANALQKYRDQLDTRTYQLNAASVKLTREIQEVWVPAAQKAEADRLRVTADHSTRESFIEKTVHNTGTRSRG